MKEHIVNGKPLRRTTDDYTINIVDLCNYKDGSKVKLVKVKSVKEEEVDTDTIEYETTELDVDTLYWSDDNETRQIKQIVLEDDTVIDVSLKNKTSSFKQ